MPIEDILGSRKAFKRAADLMMRSLARKDVGIAHPTALDALAAAHGVADWNTMSSLLEEACCVRPMPVSEVFHTPSDTVPEFGSSLSADTLDSFLLHVSAYAGLNGHVEFQVHSSEGCVRLERNGQSRIVAKFAPDFYDTSTAVRQELMRQRPDEARWQQNVPSLYYYLDPQSGLVQRVKVVESQGSIRIAFLTRLPMKPSELGIPSFPSTEMSMAGGVLHLVCGPVGSGRTMSQAAMVRHFCEQAPGSHVVADLTWLKEHRFAEVGAVRHLHFPAKRSHVRQGLQEATRARATLAILDEISTPEDLRACVDFIVDTDATVIAVADGPTVATALTRLFGAEGMLDLLVEATVARLGLVSAQVMAASVGGGLVVAREHLMFTDALRKRVRGEGIGDLMEMFRNCGVVACTALAEGYDAGPSALHRSMEASVMELLEVGSISRGTADSLLRRFGHRSPGK